MQGLASYCMGNSCIVILLLCIACNKSINTVQFLRFLRLTGTSLFIHHQTVLVATGHRYTPFLPSYYELFCVEYITHHSISSYLLGFSPVEQANIFSDQVYTRSRRLMRPFICADRIPKRRKASESSLALLRGVIVVYGIYNYTINNELYRCNFRSYNTFLGFLLTIQHIFISRSA